MSETAQPAKNKLLHFVAVKNGQKFNFCNEKTEYDARTRASVELGTCSEFYQVNDKGERI